MARNGVAPAVLVRTVLALIAAPLSAGLVPLATSRTSGHQQTPEAPSRVTLTAGMVIDRSVTFEPGTYRLASASLDTPVLTIRGRDLVIDLEGVELVGSSGEAAPDTFAGVALLVDGGERITIRNARIRGYKVGILARGVTRLSLFDNDVSDNWKQRLLSRVEKESLVDWMSYHDNEQDQWLRYGAGIYLAGVHHAEIRGNRARRGQNGLMVTRSSDLRIWNNDFSFLSSVGLGLYRTTGSTIMHNRLDWCVRGYSHGFYNRGQDSAGLLMYEQSSRNVVAYNSVTHSGDGLFLWAGQSTMDTGRGGSNDNLFYGNDFSHAPTNGIEATFSRNTFVGNRIEENWHGVWGGYSYDSVIAGNTFIGNDEAIAIEHGQDNRIVGNTFDGDETGIRLWANPQQDPDWGYPKHRDTRSRDYLIAGNTFTGVGTPFAITATTGVRIEDQAPQARPRVTPPAPMPDGIDAMIPAGGRRGRQFIIVDEWGPYDWTTPKLWPVARAEETPLRLRVLGPAGRWRLDRVRGATVSAREGDIPGEITVTPAEGSTIDFEVVLRNAEGRRFGYERFFVPIDWRVSFFDVGHAPDTLSNAERFKALLASAPLARATTDRLDYLSSRAIADGVPANHVALVAEGDVLVPEGQHDLRTISDDGVRVWVDGVLAIDNWSTHESAIDTASISSGRRRLRVEYYERTGFAELRVEIVKRPVL